MTVSQAGSEKQLFTSETLEKTFKSDFYVMCYNSHVDMSFQVTTRNVSKLKDILERARQKATNNENDNATTSSESTKNSEQDYVVVSGEEPSAALTYDDNWSSVTTSISLDSTHSRLSETVVFNIREPFNFEFKNRLLNRGPLQQLKRNASFAAVHVDLPEVKAHTFIALQNANYSVLKEIGRGSYAKIYTIQASDKSLKALKVSFQKYVSDFLISCTRILTIRI